MSVYEVGRLAVKLAGRDAQGKCVIIDVIDDNFVLIDGQVRRKRCNKEHLELLDQKIDIKKEASHEEVVSEFKKLGIELKEKKPKKAAERPRKKRKTPEELRKQKEERKKEAEKAAEETKKAVDAVIQKTADSQKAEEKQKPAEQPKVEEKPAEAPAQPKPEEKPKTKLEEEKEVKDLLKGD